MVEELHIILDSKSLAETKSVLPVCSTYEATVKEISRRQTRVNTTQLEFLSFEYAKRLFVHYLNEIYEITLCKCEGTGREIKRAMNLKKLLLAGEFEWYRTNKDKAKYYITSISITEQNANGEFFGNSYEYRVKTDSEFTNDNFKDVIFQAMEIERIYKGQLFVVIQKEVVRANMDENYPEYITTDETVINVKASLTKNRSKFIDWDKCGLALPPIYEIDRENSTIEIEI